MLLEMGIWPAGPGSHTSKAVKKTGQNQPMTMNLKMGNVDIARVRAYIKEHPEEFPRLNNDTSIIDRANRLSIGGFVRTLEKARKEGAITFEREDILFFKNNPGRGNYKCDQDL